MTAESKQHMHNLAHIYDKATKPNHQMMNGTLYKLTRTVNWFSVIYCVDRLLRAKGSGWTTLMVQNSKYSLVILFFEYFSKF